MTANDLHAGLRLCRLARWNQLAADWLQFLDSPNGTAWLAELGGVAIGSVAVLRYPPHFAWLSMMLVDPAHRRAGVGSRLMEVALDTLAGEACVRLDATPVGEPMYRRFGFVDEYPLARATAPSLTRRDLPADVRPMAAADLPRIVERDCAIFGADRGPVLASLYGRAPQLAAVAASGAYCFGRPGHLYHQLGPIVADTPAEAAALVSFCRVDGPLAIDVPRHSPDWIRYLESRGFTVERPFLRMRRGHNPSPGDPSRQFAIVGPEFG
jgi:GNAT superfamily N-acetyltransferase